MDENNIDFKTLSSKEQIAELSRNLSKITSQIYENRQADIISGNLEIVDIAYNITSDSEIVYDVTFLDKEKHETHEFYNADLIKMDLSQSKIDSLKSIGVDVSSMEKQYKELSSLSENPQKISLLGLKQKEAESKDLASLLDIDEKSIDYVSSIGSTKPQISSKSIKGIKSDDISSSEKVSTHYTIGDVIGGNYVGYKIIKTNNGSPIVLGINEDGSAEKIDNSKLEFVNGIKSMSLMRDDGVIKEVGVVTAFRIKDSGSTLNQDQVVGLSSDRGNVNGFYARGGITSDRILGEEIPSNTYSTKKVLPKQILDTRENPEIAGESDSAKARTDNNSIAMTNDISPKHDLEELAETYASVYRIDKDTLLKETIENIENGSASRNEISDEEYVIQTAENIVDNSLAKESEEKESYSTHKTRDLGDHGDGSPSMEERTLGNIHHT